MSRSVLMVSWLFAPNVSIGAKRALRFARWLPSLGWRPTVLCRRVTPASQRDPSPAHLPPEVTVRHEYDHPVFARFADGGAAPPAATPSAPLDRSLRERLAERWSLFVDAMVPTETVAIHAPHAMARIDALAPAHDVLDDELPVPHTRARAPRGAAAREAARGRPARPVDAQLGAPQEVPPRARGGGSPGAGGHRGGRRRGGHHRGARRALPRDVPGAGAEVSLRAQRLRPGRAGRAAARPATPR